MSKYIIELGDSAKKVVAIYLDEGAVWTGVQVVEDLEVLNSDYINEHYGDLQDTAYQRGLDDAWEAARKIITWPDRSLVNSDTFDLDPGENIFTKYSASEAIERLKSYEEKQDDKFEFGDEIIDSWGVKGCVVSKDNEGFDTMYVLFDEYIIPQCVTQSKYRKTGKHYDIEKILEAMKE